MGKGYDQTSMGQRICALRCKKGWTQKELAQAAGCSVGFLSRIERGSCGMTVTTFLRICRALECRPSDLIV